MALTDNNPMAPLSKEEREQELIKYGIRMAAITIMVVFGFMSSCTMMPDFVDEDQAKVKIAEADGNVKIAQQKHNEEMAKIAAIEKLIKEHNVDPIAARCAVEGINRQNDSVCSSVAGAPQKGINVNITTKKKE